MMDCPRRQRGEVLAVGLAVGLTEAPGVGVIDVPTFGNSEWRYDWRRRNAWGTISDRLAGSARAHARALSNR